MPTRSNLPGGIDTSSATLVAADLLFGKTAFGSAGTIITGTMANNGALGTYTPTTSPQSIPAGYTSGGTVAGDTDLISANIKSGINIFGVNGDSNVVNTSTGTATAGQILSGSIAFVGGSSVTGTMTNRGATNYTPTTSNQTVAAGYHNGSGVVYGDANLVAGKIQVGVSIFGITGTYTNDATASVGQILSGQTAYVNGSKLTGTMTNKVGSNTVFTPTTTDVTITAGYYGGAATDGKVAGSANLTAANIKNGVAIFGVNGTYTGGGNNSLITSFANFSGAVSGSGIAHVQFASNISVRTAIWFKNSINAGGTVIDGISLPTSGSVSCYSISPYTFQLKSISNRKVANMTQVSGPGVAYLLDQDNGFGGNNCMSVPFKTTLSSNATANPVIDGVTCSYGVLCGYSN